MINFSTERLLLRPFTTADAQFVLELHQNPDLIRFIARQALHDLDAARERIDRFRTLLDHPMYGFFCVTLRDETPVGLIMCKPIPASAGVDLDDVEIGWRQHARHTGRGYMTEAARAVLDHALGSGLDRVVAVTDPENAASQRVCARLGMQHLGTTTDYYDEACELFVATPAPRDTHMHRSQSAT